MVAAAEVHQPWWMDERKLLMRRLSRLNFVHRELTEGLPDGVTVRRESTKTANDMLVIYVDGQQVERISNMKGDAAAPVAQWIELYRKEFDMDVSSDGIKLLMELHAAKGSKERAYVSAHGATINALEKKGLIVKGIKNLTLTDAGVEVLRELPEFDEPISAPTVEEQSVDVPGLTITLNGMSNVTAERLEAFAAYLDAAVVEGSPSVDERLVRVVMADGIGLEAVVKHCGSEIMGLGGTVIKLEVGEALLRELYPPLVKFLEGLAAINVRYNVFGDLQIVVERPLADSNEQIPFGLT